jgi:hypothetical protein
MGTRNLLKRIEQAEASMKAQSIFSPGCICFPENERPSFGFTVEMEIASNLQCPLHGKRFTPLFHIYVPLWLRENLWKHLWTYHSEQYRKAWFASFPPNLWPAEEEESPDGKLLLKLKDGTRYLADERAWKRTARGALAG